MVLDNYTGDLGRDVDILLKPEWKVIIITRNNVDNCSYPSENIQSFKELTDIYELVEMNLGRRLIENEYQTAGRLHNKPIAETFCG